MSAEPERLLVPADIYDEALQFCNARRAEIGLEPITELPAGQPSTQSCPCARSVPGLLVGAITWMFEDRLDSSTVGHPTQFVCYFDQHAKPGTPTLPVREGATNV